MQTGEQNHYNSVLHDEDLIKICLPFSLCFTVISTGLVFIYISILPQHSLPLTAIFSFLLFLFFSIPLIWLGYFKI